MQKPISNNKSINITPETQCNKTHFCLFKIIFHWSFNPARSRKKSSQTQNQNPT